MVARKLLAILIFLLAVGGAHAPSASFSYAKCKEAFNLNLAIEEKRASLKMFMDLMAFKESSNNPLAVNTLGYIGKYSFGAAALKDIGICGVPSPDTWPEQEQDKAFLALTIKNRGRLAGHIEAYKGQTVNGIYITEAGILAAAHLAGASGVKRFLDHGIVAQDAYGTTIADYMRDFSHIYIDQGILLASIN